MTRLPSLPIDCQPQVEFRLAADASPGPTDRWRTPPQVAALLRVEPQRVRSWIRSGRLAAVNLAEPGCRRPRFRVSPEALQAFLDGRAVQPPTPKALRRRRQADPNVIEFYQ